MVRERRDKFLRNILAVTGCAVIFASLYFSFSLYSLRWDSSLLGSTFRTYLLILIPLYLFITAYTGLNKSFMLRNFFKETFIVFQLTCIVVVVLILMLFWMHKPGDSHRLVFGYFFVLFFTLELTTRYIVKFSLSNVFNKSKFSSRVLVVTENNCRETVKTLIKNFDWTKKICGVCVPEITSTNKRVRGVDAVCVHSQLLDYLTHNNVDEIFVTSDLIESQKMKDILSQAEEMGIRVDISLNLELFDYLPRSFIRVSKLGNIHCISVSRNFCSKRKIFAKHVLDYTGGFVGFLIFCMVYVVLAPIIKLDSKGPVLFSQNRVGRNGRIFKCYKFRSMRSDAEELKKSLMSKNEMNGLMFKMENDPRITKVGHFIRKTSLDELPQFINVLKGDMSLVGTRPPTVDEYSNYEPKHKARVSMAPGLTGLWQVSGRSDIKDFDEVVKLDMKYIDNWSVLLDLKIIFMTVLVVLFGRGAK